MMKGLPASLQGRFALALGLMAALVMAAGALAVAALLAFSDQASRVAHEQLRHLQDAQAMLEHTRQIRLYAAQSLTPGPVDDVELDYGTIMRRLDEIDRLTTRLAISDDPSVLDLFHGSQVFRSTAQVVAQLREQNHDAATAAAVRRDLRETTVQMQGHARAMVEAAAASHASQLAAYRASADALVASSRLNALIVAVLLLGSLALALVVVRQLLGRHLVARLRLVSQALRQPAEAGTGQTPAATTRVPVTGEDEIAQMARAVEQFLRERQQLASTRAALEDGSRRLAAVLDNTADAILVVQDGRLQQCNRAAQRLLGGSGAELGGRAAEDFVDAAVLQAARAGVSVALDASLRRRDGTALPVEVTLSQVHTRDTQLLIMVARDATLRREAERQMHEAREAAEAARATQSAFLASMSHELRTPLNGILGYAQLLRLGGQLADREARQVEVIERSGQHLLALINDVLDLARHEAGRIELMLDEVELAPLVHTVADIVRVQADEAGLGFAVELDPALPATLRADEMRLKQVLLNLTSNAIKFTERGRVRLVLTARPGLHGAREGRVRFDVHDTGVGMTAAQVQALFQPFEQFGAARRRAAGTGLGMAISQRLVQLMGGQIDVRSTPGAGSCIGFELPQPGPAADQDQPGHPPLTAAPAPMPPSAALPLGRRWRVLVVDDDDAGRQLMTGLLGSMNIDATTAADGRQALAAARAVPPDLVISDVRMPGMGGIALAAAMRADEALRAVPVLLVSASFDAAALRQAGLEDVTLLPKPVQRDALRRQIERLSSQARARQNAAP